MILVVDMCRADLRLSRYEFVDPIVAALTQAGATSVVKHYSEVTSCDRFEGVVLCGTALKDGTYLEDLDAFSWLKGCVVPVLGICAGMQVIAALYGADIEKRPEIGLREISIIYESDLLGAPRTIQGYHLHTFAPQVPAGFDVIAGSESYVEAFRSRSHPQYGIIFHPEVRNTWILDSFASLCNQCKDTR